MENLTPSEHSTLMLQERQLGRGATVPWMASLLFAFNSSQMFVSAMREAGIDREKINEVLREWAEHIITFGEGVCELTPREVTDDLKLIKSLIESDAALARAAFIDSSKGNT